MNGAGIARHRDPVTRRGWLLFAAMAFIWGIRYLSPQ
jgi:hypothetical protein